MLDFYGNEYVESRWTRFEWLSDLMGFENARTRAFSVWAENLVKQLKAVQPKLLVVVNGRETPNFAGNIRDLFVRLPELAPTYQMYLSLYHYDSMTKLGVDPGKTVVEYIKKNYKTNNLED